MNVGMQLVKENKCPLGCKNPMGCMFCDYGHMTECHYPHKCDSEHCHHYDNYSDDSDVDQGESIL